MVIFSSFEIIHESRISRMYFESQMAGEFSMSQILLKLGVKWPLVKAFQLYYIPAWSEMVRFSSFAIVLESKMYFESQMAGEFSRSQILLKLGVKRPLVKAFQLHYISAWSEIVRFSSFEIILSLECSLKLNWLENSQCLRSCSNLVWSGL